MRAPAAVAPAPPAAPVPACLLCPPPPVFLAAPARAPGCWLQGRAEPRRGSDRGRKQSAGACTARDATVQLLVRDPGARLPGPVR